MLSQEKAAMIANEWISAWNSHDLKDIIDHYAEEIEFTSPFIIDINNDPRGTIWGTKELKSYFERALQRFPDLHFELNKVLSSVNSIVIYYKSVKGLQAAEYMELNDGNKIIKVMAHYAK